MRTDRQLDEVLRDMPDSSGGAKPASGAPAGSLAAWLHRKRSVWAALGTGVSIAIIILSVFVLVHTLAQVSLADLRDAFHATSFEQIAAACCFTGLSYLALTGYDALALRQMRFKVPYSTTALGSFTSYAISFTLGFYVVTAGAVRYWIYSRAGLTAGRVALLTVIAGLTFWLGIGAALAVSLVIEAYSLTEIDHLPGLAHIAIGLGVLAGYLAYLTWVSLKRRRARIYGFNLELPRAWLTLGQMVLGIADVCAAAAALYALLPPGNELAYVTFLAVYCFAGLLGMASHAPGGIGVLEATMLKVMVALPSPALLASLLLFRAIYFLVPFVLAMALLGALEAARRWRSLIEALASGADE